MVPQAYKVVKIHAHEILVCTILSIIIHVRSPNLGRMNVDDNYKLVTLSSNNRENIEDFIVELLDSKNRLTFLEKLYPLQDFSSIT